MTRRPQQTIINRKQWYAYSDANLFIWGGNVAETASLYEVDLKIDAGELETIQDAVANFQTAYGEASKKKAEYEAAVEEKERARLQLIDAMRPFVGQWQNDPSIPTRVFELLDIPGKPKPGPRSSPNAPTALVAIVGEGSSVTFSWARNGNSRSTTFFLQRDTDEAWVTVWAGTRQSIQLSGFTPGERVVFRMVALRNGQYSQPSNATVIYGNLEDEALSLAA